MNFWSGYWLGNIFGSNNDEVSWKEKKEILEREERLEKEKLEKEKKELQEKIFLFLRNTKLVKKCLVCGGDKFLFDIKDTRHIKCFNADPMGYEAYSVNCKKCGYVYLFLKSNLEAKALSFKPKKVGKK
jgi:hypothetical protein